MGVFNTQVSGTGVATNPITPSSLNDAKDNENSSKALEDRFLKLLIAQMRNQDPTNPMDNSQLTAQLAQISTLAGIEKLNATVNGVSGRMTDNATVNASKLIGKGVIVPGDKILVQTMKKDPIIKEYRTTKEVSMVRTDTGTPSSSDNSTGGIIPLVKTYPNVGELPGKDKSEAPEIVTTPFGFELERDADSVVVTINDANGKKVREVDMGTVKAGVSTFTWNGKLDDEETSAPDGSYTFTVTAFANDQKISAAPLTHSMVFGVIRNKNSDAVFLDLGLSGTININEIRQILD